MATLLDPASIQRPSVARDPGINASPALIRDPRAQAIAQFGDTITAIANVHTQLLEKRQGAEDNSFLDAYQLEYAKRSSQYESDHLNSQDVNSPDFVNTLDTGLKDLAETTRNDVIKSGGYRPSQDALTRSDHFVMGARTDAARNAVTQANNQRISALVDNATNSATEIAKIAGGTGDVDGALAKIDEIGNSLNGVLAPAKVQAWKDAQKQIAVENAVHGLKDRGETDKAQALVDRYTGFASTHATYTGKSVVDAAKSQGVDPAVALGMNYLDSTPGAPPKQPPAPDRFMATPVAPAGMVQKGNIDLTTRPSVKNADGTISTVRSISIEEDGREILIPTISDDGRVLSNKEAIDLYHQTGKNLGIFKDAASATSYAKDLHEQQAAPKVPAGTKTYGLSQTVLNVVDTAANDQNLDPGLLRRIAAVESGGDPSNVTGGYKGLFQLSDAEFKSAGTGGSIWSAADNARAAAVVIRRKIDSFQADFGRPPTETEIYLMHQQGEGGLRAHVAHPNAPAWQNMASTAEGKQKGEAWAKAAIWGNIPDDIKKQFPGGVDTVTSAQFMDLWAKRLGDAGGSIYTVDDPAIRSNVARIAADTNLLQRRLGTPPTPAEIYLSSVLGADGVVALLTTQGDTPVTAFLPSEILKAHPEFANLTADGLHKWAADRIQTAMQATQGELVSRPIYADSWNLPISTANSLNNELASAKTQDKTGLLGLIRDDIASTQRTGVGLNIDPVKAKAILTPSEFTSWQENRQDAATVYETTHDLSTLTEAQINERRDAVEPKPGTIGYDRAADIADHYNTEADKVLKLRASDPAASVADAPSVKAAMDGYDPKDAVASWKKIVDARLAAQAAVGVDPLLVSPVTKAEAGKWALAIKGANQADFYARFQQMASGVEGIFGDYADEVLHQIVTSFVSDDLESRMATDIITDMLTRRSQPRVLAKGDFLRPARAADTAVEIGRQDGAMPRPLHETSQRKFGDFTLPPGVASERLGLAPGSADLAPGDPGFDLKGAAQQTTLAEARAALQRAQQRPGFQSWMQDFFSNPNKRGTAMPQLVPQPEDIAKLRGLANNPKAVADFVAIYGPDAVPADLRSKIPEDVPLPPVMIPRPVPAPKPKLGLVPGGGDLSPGDPGFRSGTIIDRQLSEVVWANASDHGQRHVPEKNKVPMGGMKIEKRDDLFAKAQPIGVVGASPAQLQKPINLAAPAAAYIGSLFKGPALTAFQRGLSTGEIKVPSVPSAPPLDAFRQAFTASRGYINTEKWETEFKDAFGPMATVEGLTPADVTASYDRAVAEHRVQGFVDSLQAMWAIILMFGTISKGANEMTLRAPEKQSSILGVRG